MLTFIPIIMTQEINKISKDNFPAILQEIPQTPEALYVLGTLIHNQPHIAIVGTRKATETGRKTAYSFAKELGENGFVIVSGLAMGIDTAAHEGALAAGAPTIAVLAKGVNLVYPRQNENLAKKILAGGGALVSEYPDQANSFPAHFIRRNRIVSGLALGVLIVEAPERSGTLATARFALEQNRDIFVVPGPVTNINYKGSHRLIQDGAALITTPKEICELLAFSGKIDPPSQSKFDKSEEDPVGYPKLAPIERTVCEAILKIGSPATVDEIVSITGLTAQVVAQTTSTLTIGGIISDIGGRYILTKS
jgi:DNA processing protein